MNKRINKTRTILLLLSDKDFLIKEASTKDDQWHQSKRTDL